MLLNHLLLPVSVPRPYLVWLLLLNYLLVVGAGLVERPARVIDRPFAYAHSPDCQLHHTLRLGLPSQRTLDTPRIRIGLACAGGVVEGAFYEVGALYALQEAVPGLELNRLHVYVGVSSGAMIATFLAAGIPISALLGTIAGSSATDGTQWFTAEELSELPLSKTGRRVADWLTRRAT